MAVITVRNLDDEVQRKIRERAASHNQSMEAEARAILTSAVTNNGFASAWLALAERHRGFDIPDPDRKSHRTVDFS